jgi:hypothetical protein
MFFNTPMTKKEVFEAFKPVIKDYREHVRHMVAEYPDDNFRESGNQDIKDLMAVRDAYTQKDPSKAYDLAWHMDTFVRDYIPSKVWDSITRD